MPDGELFIPGSLQERSDEYSHNGFFSRISGEEPMLTQASAKGFGQDPMAVFANQSIRGANLLFKNSVNENAGSSFLLAYQNK